MCTLVTLMLFAVMNGWNPPFEYRLREAPLRDLHAHTEFQFEDFRATEDEQEREMRNFRNYYANDDQLPRSNPKRFNRRLIFSRPEKL